MCDHTCNVDTVPQYSHDHRFFLRRDISTGKPLEAVVWAVWQGDWAELHTWPWNAEGLAAAQAWCDRHEAIWHDSHYPVMPDSLAVHADAA